MEGRDGRQGNEGLTGVAAPPTSWAQMSDGNEITPRPPQGRNPFADPALARGYEAWYAGPGRRADELEKRLLGRWLRRFPAGAGVLEVGCGTGHFTRWIRNSGFAPTGVDVSSAMLEQAERADGIRYLRGDAMALPFEDGAFDVVAFITSLEFVPDSERALDEALRVARRGLLLGGLNRHSWLGRQCRRSGQLPWTAANFYTVGELIAQVRARAGGRLARLSWRTTLWPVPGVGSLPLPWGGFIGRLAELHPPAKPRKSS